MPRGQPGSGKVKTPIIRSKSIARDLVQDVARRVCTPYDSLTILRMLAPEDTFSIIVPEKDLVNVRVPYDYEHMEIADDLGDDELNKLASIYRKASAVIIKSPKE